MASPKRTYALLCAACGTAGGLQRCGRCHAVCYCHSACQKQNWPLHRLLCRSLEAPPADAHPTTAPSELLAFASMAARVVKRADVELAHEAFAALAGDAAALARVRHIMGRGSASPGGRIQAYDLRDPPSVVREHGFWTTTLHEAAARGPACAPAVLAALLPVPNAAAANAWARVYEPETFPSVLGDGPLAPPHSVRAVSVTPMGAALVYRVHRPAGRSVAPVLRALLAAGADAKAPAAVTSLWAAFFHEEADSFTALHLAAASCDTESVALLLSAGADPRALSGTQRWSALEMALRNVQGHELDTVTATALALVKAGASPTSARADLYGRAIDYAGRTGNARVFSDLLAAGADPHPRAFVAQPAKRHLSALGANLFDSVTWIQLAAERGHADVITLAANAGMDVNVRAPNKDACTALQTAVVMSQPAVVAALLATGKADVNLTYRYVWESKAETGDGMVHHARLPAEPGAPEGLVVDLAIHSRVVGDTIVYSRELAGTNALESDLETKTALDVALGRNENRRDSPQPEVVAMLRAAGAKTAAELGVAGAAPDYAVRAAQVAARAADSGSE